ncbi:hypothetical protein GCK32_007790 [Trichostrongylus colubriformis]|uniref:Uncharacterized protein n=1 Tax=Trichostrongylus colubriformis TaxID=6319 RepID=A0AAN8FST1_TRICO
MFTQITISTDAVFEKFCSSPPHFGKGELKGEMCTVTYDFKSSAASDAMQLCGGAAPYVIKKAAFGKTTVCIYANKVIAKSETKDEKKMIIRVKAARDILEGTLVHGDPQEKHHFLCSRIPKPHEEEMSLEQNETYNRFLEMTPPPTTEETDEYKEATLLTETGDNTEKGTEGLETFRTETGPPDMLSTEGYGDKFSRTGTEGLEPFASKTGPPDMLSTEGYGDKFSRTGTEGLEPFASKTGPPDMLSTEGYGDKFSRTGTEGLEPFASKTGPSDMLSTEGYGDEFLYTPFAPYKGTRSTVIILDATPSTFRDAWKSQVQFVKNINKHSKLDGMAVVVIDCPSRIAVEMNSYKEIGKQLMDYEFRGQNSAVYQAYGIARAFVEVSKPDPKYLEDVRKHVLVLPRKPDYGSSRLPKASGLLTSPEGKA